MDEEHPIRVVARRTGLTPHVIRVWEKRYAAVTPKRSSTNRRFYTNADIHRLNLLRRATQSGRSIGQIARLPTERLEARVQADESAAHRLPQVANFVSAEFKPEKYLDDCLAAICNLDAPRFEASLASASLNLSKNVFLQELIAPLMTRIGDLWNEGTLAVVHEHLASAMVRTLLGSMSDRYELEGEMPHIIVTTPAGQHHEFGALIAAITALSNGWRATYLGPNLPVEEIARAAQQTKARAVAVSITYPSDNARLAVELQKLRRLLGNIAMIAGGRAVEFHRQALQSINAIIVSDLTSLRSELEALRTGRSQMEGTEVRPPIVDE